MSHYFAFRKVLDGLRTLPPSRAKELAIQHLEESAFWASAAIVGKESPIEYVTPECDEKPPESTNVIRLKPS